MLLRPYQEKLLDEVRQHLRAGVRSILVQLPTGGGKTVIIGKMFDDASKKGVRSAFGVHRRELVQQSVDTFTEFNIKHGVVSAGYHPMRAANVQIASIPTWMRRTKRVGDFRFIAWDECVSAETIVDTDVGLIRICEIPYLGASKVLSFENGVAQYKRITAWRRTKPQKVKSLVLADGRVLRGSSGHPVRTGKGWKTIGEITTGERVLCLPTESVPAFSAPSLATPQLCTPTSGRGRHASAQITHRSKLNGYFIKLLSFTAWVAKYLSQTMAGLVTSIVDLLPHAYPRSSKFSTLFLGRGRSGFPWNGWSSLGQRESLGGTSTMASMFLTDMALGFTPKDLAGMAPNWHPAFSINDMAMPASTGISAVAHTQDLASGALRDWSMRSHNTRRSVWPTSWVEVTSTDWLDEEAHLYDISVEDTECFFANGVLTHNCHHLASKSWEALHAMYPEAVHIGLTATPERLDGRGLGKYFDAMVTGPSTRQLIRDGYLSPFRMLTCPSILTDGLHTRMGDFAIGELIERANASTLTGDAIDHYKQHANGRRAVMFECSVARSEQAAQAFKDAGIPAAHVDGKTPQAERDRLIRDFRRGDIRVLSNVELFGEGFDLPAMEAVILCRPTQSLSLYLQQVGRGLRTAPGKQDCVILDHAGNYARHGSPDAEREWTLAGRVSGGSGDKAEPMGRQCRFCSAVSAPQRKTCVECGAAFPVKERKVVEVEGELVELEMTEEEQRRHDEIRESMTMFVEKDFDALVQEGRRRCPRNPYGWAMWVLEGRRRKRA